MFGRRHWSSNICVLELCTDSFRPMQYTKLRNCWKCCNVCVYLKHITACAGSKNPVFLLTQAWRVFSQQILTALTVLEMRQGSRSQCGCPGKQNSSGHFTLHIPVRACGLDRELLFKKNFIFYKVISCVLAFKQLAFCIHFQNVLLYLTFLITKGANVKIHSKCPFEVEEI